MAELPDLTEGTIFAGRYRIIGPLGEGSRKRTYLVDDTLLGRRVALALIKPEAAQDDPAGTRREAETLAQAGTHDNVVTLYDQGTADGIDYLVFAYLAAGTLHELITERTEHGNPLSVGEVLRFGRQLARALKHVHELGFIHRDVAPANVWLDEYKTAHLGDFDSAIRLGAAEDATDLPPTTEAYAAPEQLDGAAGDERSDLYSLGAVLFEALTGERPARETAAAMAQRLARLRPDVPPNMNELICRLLAQSPAGRPSSAAEVLEALLTSAGVRPSDAGAREEPTITHVMPTPGQDVLSWAETLPFPLASLLWCYDGETEAEGKITYLLKFFEVLAQFVATIQLSAAITNRDFFSAHRDDWFEGGPDRRQMELSAAGFGVWLELSARLAKTFRPLLTTDEGASLCRELFKATDLELAERLTSRKLADILRHALDRRNTWSGHGGIAGYKVHRERLEDLKDLLIRTQRGLGRAFDPWILLKPGPMTYTRGIFDVKATVLKGANSAFRKRQIRVEQILDLSRLYLWNDGRFQALELVPFIRVLPSSKTGDDVFYFYSRLQGRETHWISYHFHAEPEQRLPGKEVAELLETLLSAGRPEPQPPAEGHAIAASPIKEASWE